MNVFLLRLRPLSPWVTPWHSSSLWGSLCWALADILDPSEFAQWLSAAREGHPHFVVSDAFPAGLLPFPAGIRANTTGHKLKAAWITRETFLSFAQTASAELPPAATSIPPFLTSSTQHAVIGRATNTTDEGDLFEIDVQTFSAGHREPHELDVYMAVEDRAADTLLAAWSLLALRGFGRYRSSGLGAFELVTQLQPQGWLEDRSSARGFMALSHFVPAPNDPTDGAWRLAVSYPKFQGDLVQRYLKGRVVYIAPGALFRSSDEIRPYYGSALAMARPEFPGAIHPAFCLAAPLNAPWWEKSN